MQETGRGDGVFLKALTQRWFLSLSTISLIRWPPSGAGCLCTVVRLAVSLAATH